MPTPEEYFERGVHQWTPEVAAALQKVADAYLIQLFDARGALIFSETARGTHYLDVSNYSVGMYYLRTMDAKGSHSFQLSVQH